MRPLVWWVQDHLGLAAVGLFAVAAAVVAVVLVTSGSSGSASDAPAQTSKVAATATPKVTRPNEEKPAPARQAHKRDPRVSPAHERHATHRPKAEQTRTATTQAPPPKRKHHAAPTTTRVPPGPGGSPPSNDTGSHSISPATAEKVAAAHPGVSCPKGYSREQCEEAVQAAASPAPSTPVTQPSDCGAAMSAVQCEELFAAEAAAREAGGASVPAQECIEHPEQEKCAAVLEMMKAQYEAAHPGG